MITFTAKTGNGKTLVESRWRPTPSLSDERKRVICKAMEHQLSLSTLEAIASEYQVDTVNQKKGES